MTKIYTVIAIILLVTGYFWYVRGVEIGPLLEKAASLHIEITFEETLEESPTSSSALGTWRRTSEAPTARTEVAAALLGTKIFVIGGLDGFGRSLDTVEIYDTVTGEWTQGAPLPEKRHHTHAAVLNNTLYVVGGHSGLNFAKSGTAWKYSTKDGSWEEIAQLPEAVGAGTLVGFDPIVQSPATNKLYLFGGATKEGVSDKVFIYDPEKDEWSEGKKMPTAREHLSAGVIGNKIYVVGGRRGSLTKNEEALEIYFPKNDIWAQGEPMPTRRGGIAATVLNGNLYVLGGEEPLGTFDEVEVYRSTRKKWVSLTPMPSPRHGLAAVTVDGKIHVIAGGKRPILSVSNIHEIFTPPEQFPE